MTWRRHLTTIPVAALVAGLATACTPGAETVRLTATFDDVRHLAPRHAVRIADARVGTVAAIALDGHRARVTLDVEPDVPVPVDTMAVIRQTSLLGENYVELRLPPGIDPTDAPALADGDEIDDTMTVVELEDLMREGTAVLGAISASDVDVILDAAVEGIGDRGPQLNRLVGRLADLSTEYASYGDDLGAIIEGLAELGADLEAGRGDIAAAIDAAAGAGETAARQRERLVASLEAVAEASRAAEDGMLTHADELSRLFDDLVPVTGTLVDQREQMVEILEGLVRFNERLPTATPNRPLQIYARMRSESGFEQTLVELVNALEEQVLGDEEEAG